MTLIEFTPIYTGLAHQLQAQDADEAQLRVYYKALQGLERELVEMAANRLAIKAHYFPKTSEWYAEARLVETEREQELRAILRRRVRPLCDWCYDTGWKPRDDGRVEKCHCAAMRREEVLGRRPMPLLESA